MNLAKPSPRTVILGSLLALALGPAAALPVAWAGDQTPTAASSRKLTLENIVSLLKAGVGESVILRQVETTSTRLTLTVEGILQLKAAGASDHLLESLQASREMPPAQTAGASPAAETGISVPEGAPFRILTLVNEKGERVLYLTNVDASGRRIGGELPERTPNLIQERGERDRRSDGDSSDRVAPVIVNVYPPEPAAAEGEPYGDEPDDQPAYGYGRYPGYLPGLYGYGYGYGRGSYHRHGPSCGRPFGYAGPYRSAFAPPGSYSHFLVYHHPDVAGTFSTLPYQLGNAAARNRAAFRHR
jgi:hypothetical protein